MDQRAAYVDGGGDGHEFDAERVASGDEAEQCWSAVHSLVIVPACHRVENDESSKWKCDQDVYSRTYQRAARGDDPR